MTNKITQAVIPCAGLGTRFLPVTKSVPKELLPLFDRPCLQTVIEEAVASGIEEIIFITSKQKPLLEHYFKPNDYLDDWLTRRHKKNLLEQIKLIEKMARFRFVIQDEPLGLGHAVRCAENEISTENFMVLLPDDLIDAEIPACRQMIKEFQSNPKAMVSVMPVAWEQVNLYGIVKAGPLSEKTGLISHIVEKPEREQAPSNLAVIGRYILPKKIFTLLRNVKPGSGGEIQLTDALLQLALQNELISFTFAGQRFDTGNPLGLLEAAISYALKDPKSGPSLTRFIKTISAAL